MSESCTRCSNKQLTLNDFEIKPNGDRYSTCNYCREYSRIRKLNDKDRINAQSRLHYLYVREQKAEQVKQWRIDNKDRLTAKIECPCGGKFQFRQKSEHLRTQKHIKWLETQNNNNNKNTEPDSN